MSFATIQAAVNNAGTGDIIQIDPGIYTESVTIDRQITLEGAGSGTNPSSNTIIEPGDGGYAGHRCDRFRGADAAHRLVLQDLRITGAGRHGRTPAPAYRSTVPRPAISS